ncbi:MAG: NifU family protein [Bdellovibrionales bacterium]|nr:NifU family protein [Bdellovibrionales bacterium]
MSEQSETTLSPDDVLVRPQPTPNPAALKFVVNQPLKREGKATINAPEEVPELKLVESLFQVQGVKQLHFFQNTVTVTHEGSLSPEELIENVIPVLKTRIPIHNPDFGEPEPKAGPKKDRDSLSPEVQQVEEILDRTIRPGLQADGGDVEVIKMDGNEVYILYQGACGGCPSSMMGTLDAIQSILQHEMANPEISVIPI